jgi:hypothetical protein
MNKEFFELQKAKHEAENSKWTAKGKLLMVITAALILITTLVNLIAKCI